MKIAVRRTLALAVASSLAVGLPAYAATLTPGQSATVQPGDLPETWQLNNAELIVNPGGKTLDIFAGPQSQLKIAGAEIAATGSSGGINLQASTLTLSNSAVTNSAGRGMTLASGGSSEGSTANITNSQITGLGLGISVFANPAGRSTLTLDRTQVIGRMNGTATPALNGNGIAAFDGADILVGNGSIVTGEANGVFTTGNRTTPYASTVVIDASRVEGKAGSALVVGVPPGSGRADIDIQFTARNGAELIGGNGNLLEVTAAAANVGFTVDNSKLTGNIINTAGSTVDVNLTNNATLLGATQNITSMAVDNARWQLSGNSSTGTLSLGSGGEIALGDGSAFHTLNVAGNYTGNGGTLTFNTVLAGDDAATDRLIIGGDTSGTTTVRVNNVGGTGAQTNQGIELIQVGGASNGQFNLAGRAVAGQYEYFLHKGTAADGNWYLRSELPTVGDPCVGDPNLPGCRPVDPTDPVTPVDPVDPTDPLDPVPLLRPEVGAYLANLQAAQRMFRLGYHDRHAGQNSGRAWARVDGSRNGFDAITRQLDIRGNSQALTVGADVWRHESGSSVGVMLSTGNASSTATNELTGYYARGKVKGEALGIYGTWRGGNGADPYAGFYVDGSVQRAQFRNRVQGVGLAEERYDSRAWQGALETGYAFRVGGASNGGIYLEPQLQVGYNRWSDSRHTEVNGTTVANDDANGLFGRAGLRLSGVTRWGNGTAEVQPYLAANWLHTRAESQIRMNDEVADARVPRSRGEFSGGASLKFANGIGAWGGLSLQRASGYHQTTAQVGVSYSW
ncbi:autotransporter outer membrane beta-barrel domain-containing protein [Stenotrophomonas maltophilia]|uniref:autotransporter family protein n=1 Tax=Stenotrophomonas maltophilia TaxID=40324 RepID=UPI0010943F0E|nr:autotransporter outer membrane beta-barrel domain-containing protein [Stenotrophomonas maltophilia]TGW15731.1 autotransporter outer membrane beta-barrel domain-containing protein [Stenotrophomonas maltophilia]